jgi:uncharacterized protein YhbP (UPF0306 family)
MKEETTQLETIAALLRNESTVALGTVDERGEPCVAALFYIVDDDLNLYWLSSANSAHSRNLGKNPTASATVYRHTENWKEICGVQMRGRVEAISNRERRSALLKIYCERFNLGRVLRLAIGRSTLYQFRPEWFRYIDNSKRFGYRFEVTREELAP